MATRFMNVLKGARGQAARTKYIAYLTGIEARPNKIGTKPNRPPSVKLFIAPFTLTLSANTYVQTSALQTAQTLMGANAEVASRQQTEAEITQTETTLKLSRFKAARIIRKEQTGTTGTVAKSNLTGLDYLKYNSKSLSVPFGKKTGDTSQTAAYNVMVTALKGGSTNLKFTLSPEEA